MLGRGRFELDILSGVQNQELRISFIDHYGIKHKSVFSEAELCTINPACLLYRILVYRTQIKKFMPILLASLLVVVQAHLILHQLEFQTHIDEPDCEICFHANLFGHASVNTLLELNIDTTHSLEPDLVRSFQYSNNLRYVVAIPRGPPSALV